MTAARTPAAALLAARPGLQVVRFTCSAGPRDRPFAEVHGAHALAVVASGSFCYRCRGRAHDLVPGAVLLGEPGETYTCSHEHGAGDVCLGFLLSERLLESAASACGAPGRLFARASLPPRPRISGLARAAEAASAGRLELGVDEIVLELAGVVLGELATHARGPARPAPEPTPVERARAIAAAAYLERSAAEPLTLADVAAHVGLSAFHFLRLFRRVIGLTPHQYLVQARVRRAAERLLDSDVPITALAHEVGFGDLSNFVRTFHRLLGAPPGQYRRRLARSEIRRVARARPR